MTPNPAESVINFNPAVNHQSRKKGLSALNERPIRNGPFFPAICPIRYCGLFFLAMVAICKPAKASIATPHQPY
nr:hypothetical protein [Thermoproteota archaeon]